MLTKLNLIPLFKKDQHRFNALKTAQSLNLNDWYLAAGFIRNFIWDIQHGIQTQLSDLDLIYFDASNTSEENDLRIEKDLNKLAPQFPWSVKNQARMHIRNNDQPYKNSIDAMRFWPEIQTAIGIKIDSQNQIIIDTPFDWNNHINLTITHNPKRERSIFESRVTTKRWLETWAKLTINN